MASNHWIDPLGLTSSEEKLQERSLSPLWGVCCDAAWRSPPRYSIAPSEKKLHCLVLKPWDSCYIGPISVELAPSYVESVIEILPKVVCKSGNHTVDLNCFVNYLIYEKQLKNRTSRLPAWVTFFKTFYIAHMMLLLKGFNEPL